MPPSFGSMENFYPRPPRGGRRCYVVAAGASLVFLSTPSARRATGMRRTRRHTRRYFYPRPPRGGRPQAVRGHGGHQISIHALREEGDHLHAVHDLDAVDISIHALREEGDKPPTGFVTTETYFYPRPPRGGRRVRQAFARRSIGFLSTPSARRATSKSSA